MGTPKAGYRAADGEKIPSVTTILGRFKDSTFLMRWVYKQGREHGELDLRGHLWRKGSALRKLAERGDCQIEVRDALDSFVFCAQPEPAPRDQYDKAGKAALAGTIAHDMIERWTLDGCKSEEIQLPLSAEGAAPEIIEKAINSYRQYHEWQRNSRIKITHTEMGLVSEKHRYGGTLDALGVDGTGTIVLIDHKTSNGVYSDYLYQLAAYAILVEENHPELAPRGFHLLRYAKESADFSHHSWGELDAQKEGFLLMRKLYALDELTKQRCR